MGGSWAESVANNAEIAQSVVWLSVHMGNVGYSVGIRGNTFVRTGGDDGIVPGIFVGPQHQGMGGTLERDDLAAGFGGVR